METQKRIFLTGVTGYIGGDVLYALEAKGLLNKHEASVLIRNKEKATRVADAYPHVRIVLGDLGDTNLLSTHAADSDIVVHCASLDDLAASEAIAQGLKDRQRPGPAFWIAISGTDNLAWKTIHNNTYGQVNEPEGECYRDDDFGIQEIFSMPDDAPHLEVEKSQMMTASDAIQIAIVSGSCIYGRGRGPVNQRSIQIPDLIAYTLKNEYSFQINDGRNRWPNVHVQDFSEIFVRLTENALTGGNPNAWGPSSGYYFGESGFHAWGDAANWVVSEASQQGYILEKADNIVSMSAEEANTKVNDFGALFYGTDSSCIGSRAREVLGWYPAMHSLRDEIAGAVADEAAVLGLTPKYLWKIGRVAAIPASHIDLQRDCRILYGSPLRTTSSH